MKTEEMSDYEIQEATTADIEIILQHRRWMFEDMGLGTNESLNRMDEAFEEWVLPRLETGEFKTWFVVDNDEVVAGVGLWIYDFLPGPLVARPRFGHICNVYTATDYRRQGLARLLMNTIIEWAKENSITILSLRSSDEGLPLYESLSFQPSPEFWLELHTEDPVENSR